MELIVPIVWIYRNGHTNFFGTFNYTDLEFLQFAIFNIN